MKIPKNATSEFFDRQVEAGTFDAVQWVRWVKDRFNREYDKDSKAVEAEMEELYRWVKAGDLSMLA